MGKRAAESEGVEAVGSVSESIAENTIATHASTTKADKRLANKMRRKERKTDNNVAATGEEKNTANQQPALTADKQADAVRGTTNSVDARNFASADANSNALLQHFWDLAHHEPDTRQRSTVALVSCLTERQRAYEASRGLQTNVVSGDLETILAPDVHYALNRLVRGLSSPRRSARQGFATALTEMLAAVVAFVPTSALLRVMDKHLGGAKPNEDVEVKPADERETLFGRVFFYFALLQAGLVLRETSSVAGGHVDAPSPTTSADIDTMVSDIVEIAARKPYLRESCFEWLMACVEELSNTSPLSASVFGAIRTHIYESENAEKLHQTADFVSLTVKLQTLTKNGMGTVKLGAQWDAPDSILDPLNFKSLAVIMKETTAECHPRVHSAWDHIIAALLRPSDGGAVSTVVAFWKIVVDDCLFASLSHERKYLGLRLLATYLGRMVDRGVAVASLLTPQLLRCLLNNLGNPTTNLHKCANQTMEAVLAVAKQNRAVALELIAALTGKSGTASMDHIRKMIKNKALLDAVLQLGLSGVDSSEVAAQSTALVDHVTWLIEKFEAIPLETAMQPSGTTPEMSGGDQQRLWCLDQLMAVVKNTAIPKTDELFESMLAFFAKHAFFNAATTMRVCSEAKRKFWVATTEFCTTKYGRGAEKGAAVSARSQLVTVVRVITRLHKQYASVTSTVASDRTLFVPWSSDFQRVLAAVKKLWKSTDEKTDSIVELLTLLLLQTMITSSEEESVGHIAVMDDLLACRAKLAGTDKRAKLAGTDKVEDTAEPLPNSVLCDLLVLLTDCMTAASADSSTALSVKLTRKLVDTVFKQHCFDMDGEGVSVLCRVLDPTIVPNEDETMDDSDSDADCDAAKQDDASSLSSGDSSSDDSDDDDADDAEPDAIFMAKLKHAMGSAAATTDANDSADDEPEDLTDEQMISMGFDDKLAEIFRNKKLEKKQKQDILKSCINFKYRILDMVELYASQGANQQPLHFDRHVIRLVLTLFRSLLLHDNPMFFVRDMKKVAAAVGDDGEKKTVRANPSAMLHLQNACELSAQQRKNLTDRMASVIRSTIQKARVRPELESRDYVLGAIAVVFRLISGVDSKTLTMQGTTDGILAIYNSAAPHPSKETQALLCDVFAWLLRGGSISFARDSVFVATTRPLCAHLLDIHLCKRNRHLTSQHLAVIFQRLCDTTIGVADDSESGAVEHALVTGTSVAWSLLASEVFSRFATSSNDTDTVDTAFWDFRRSQLWALVELFLKQARLGENEAVWYREQFAPFLTCAIDAALHGVLGSDMPSAKASAHAKKVLAPVAAFIRRLSKSDIDHGNEGDEQQLLPDTTLELIQRVGEKMSQSNAVTTHCTQLVALCHSK